MELRFKGMKVYFKDEELDVSGFVYYDTIKKVQDELTRYVSFEKLAELMCWLRAKYLYEKYTYEEPIWVLKAYEISDGLNWLLLTYSIYDIISFVKNAYAFYQIGYFFRVR